MEVKINPYSLLECPKEYLMKNFRTLLYPFGKLHDKSVDLLVDEFTNSISFIAKKEETLFFKNFIYTAIYYLDRTILPSEHTWNTLIKLSNFLDRTDSENSIFETMCEEKLNSHYRLFQGSKFHEYFKQLKETYYDFGEDSEMPFYTYYAICGFINERRIPKSELLYKQHTIPDADILYELPKMKDKVTYQNTIKNFLKNLLPIEKQNSNIGGQLADLFIENDIFLDVDKKYKNDKTKIRKSLRNRFDKIFIEDQKIKLEELQELVKLTGLTPNELLYPNGNHAHYHEWNDIKKIERILRERDDLSPFSFKIRTDSMTGISLFLHYQPNYNKWIYDNKTNVSYQILYVNPIDDTELFGGELVQSSIHYDYQSALTEFLREVSKERKTMYQFWDKHYQNAKEFDLENDQLSKNMPNCHRIK